ncbi:MAG: SigF/SigG family RNA polymerase sporulation sigma factor [Lachnospiraceae bacterium]
MEEKNSLIERAHTGDKEARNRLVEENMGLVWSVARRFVGRGQEMEDLVQIGSIGLIKAIDKFDTGFGVCFSTYAVPMIAGEIRRFLRDDGMIRVSRSLKETGLKIRLAQEKLSKNLGREPTVEEVAKEAGISCEELATAMEANAEIESLSQTIYQGDGQDITWMERLEQERNDNEILINRLTLKQLIEKLPEKERKIIIMRYFMDCTQSQIAAQLGISQVQVSRLEKRILKQMRGEIT